MDSVLKILNERITYQINEWINYYEGGYRTAPATPGLLIMSAVIYWLVGKTAPVSPCKYQSDIGWTLSVQTDFSENFHCQAYFSPKTFHSTWLTAQAQSNVWLCVCLFVLLNILLSTIPCMPFDLEVSLKSYIIKIDT